MLDRLDQHFAAPLRALNLRNARSEILAANIANADTPHFKARDIDFARALTSAQERGFEMHKTSARHLSGRAEPPLAAFLRYRIPVQDSIDGNTVETDTEVAQFSNNAIATQADLAFMSSKIRGVLTAIQSS